MLCRRKRPELSTGNWRLHHDNAPANSSNLIQIFLAKNQIPVVRQASYSPDMAPFHFCLFPKFKRPLKGNPTRALNATSLKFYLPSTYAIDRREKFTHAYEGSRSPHASALYWNPPGFRKKIGYFSNRKSPSVLYNYIARRQFNVSRLCSYYFWVDTCLNVAHRCAVHVLLKSQGGREWLHTCLTLRSAQQCGNSSW